MREYSYTAELIAEGIRGDESALSYLYESTQNKVAQTVRSMIRDEDAVLDIVQDSYVKAFRNLDKLDRPERFPLWMRRIASNTAVDYLKRKRPVLFSELVNEDGSEVEFEDVNMGHMPEALLDQKETSRLIREIIGGLSEEQQLVIGLFYFEDVPIKSIAKKLGCSENTVKSRLNYGRKNIEKQVRELEKKGTKLYSLAPLPFFLWLLRNLHTAAPQGTLGTVLSQCGSVSSGAVSTAGSTVAQAGGRIVKKAAEKAGKKIAMKIAAAVLAVTVVGGGTVVALSGGSEKPAPDQEIGISATEVQQGEETVETTIPPTQPPVDPTPAYQMILDEYASACADRDYLDHRENYPNTINDGMYYYHAVGSTDLYFAYHDIDKNGVYELLIGDGLNIWDIYGFDGEKAVKLVDIEALGGGRANLTVMDSGELYITGASGADDVTYEMLCIGDDGFSGELVFYFTSEEYSTYQGVDGSKEVVLSQEEFEEKLGAYTEATINWELLVEALMTWSEAYELIMEEYKAITAAMYDGTYAPDQQIHAKNIDREALDPENMGPGSGFYLYYSFYDIDRNGTMELLISYATEYALFVDSNNRIILDVYTFNGVEAVQLFPGDMVGYTAKLYLVNEGEMYLENDQKDGGIYILAQIAPDGYSLDVEYSYKTRLENGQVIYYNDIESYTEFEFNWVLPPLYYDNDIEWTGFTSYSEYW